MVDYLRRCALEPDQPRPSIETLLHAFVDAAHVDHTHPDAVIALTSSPDGRSLAEEAFGDEAVWLDYQRPGFDMSKRIAELLDANPSARAVLLERHGLVTWGSDVRGGLQEHHRVRHESCRGGGPGRSRPVRSRRSGRARSSGRASASPSWRRRSPRSAARSSPMRTASCSRSTGAPQAVAFASSARAPEVSQVGAPCPDHLINTKHRPLVVAFDPATRRRRRPRRRLPTRCRRVRRVVPRVLRERTSTTRRGQFPIDPGRPAGHR